MKEGSLKKPKFGCFTIIVILIGLPTILSIIAIPIAFVKAGVKEFTHGRIGNGLFIFLIIGCAAYGLYKLIDWLRHKNHKTSKFNTSESSIELETKRGKIIMNNPFRGFFVLGAAGSGKSESIAVPLLNQFIKKDFSGIVYDFKFPTLANDVQAFIDSTGKQKPHFYLNFNDPYQSHKVNPLNPKYLLNTSYAREYAQAMISNLMKESIRKPDFWSRSATDLLTACIWYLREERPDICDLPHVLAMITSNDVALLNKLQDNPTTQQMTMSIYNAMQRGADSQVSGVIGTLQGVMAQINTPELMYIFSKDDFSLDINDPVNPIILTVGSYPTLTSTFAPLCSLVITVATKLMNQPNKAPSFVLLDEAPTVFIPNIEVLPNTGRSNKVSTVIMCQDISQLTDGYGKEKADVLFSACNNHFYGRVSSSVTSEILSKQFGKTDKTYITQSRNKKAHKLFGTTAGQSETIQERDVIRPSEFLALNVGQFTGITVESNKPNFKEQFIPIARPYFAGLPSVDNSQNIYEYYKSVRADITELLSENNNLEDFHEKDNMKLSESKHNFFDV